ncbi:MAG: DUF167 family protein [Candidatus Thiodiazotropha sp. (ex Notomyrtea botanica)]|nr:DUF167 family protein [Candidatus Thiodiazotropha sp. (ex Notomyrtea botanica)]
MTWRRWEGDDLILHLRVQPKASKDALVGPYGDNEYKVTLTAPPVDGRANTHLLKFIAKTFGLPRARVILESGPHSRSKCLRLKSPTQLPIFPGD